MAVSILSTFRKLLSLHTFVQPLLSLPFLLRGALLLSSPTSPPRSIIALRSIRAFIDAAAGIADDIECAGRLRVLGVGERGRISAGTAGDFFALFGSLVGLVEAKLASSMLWRMGRATRRRMVERSSAVAHSEDSGEVEPLLGIGPPDGWTGDDLDWEELSEQEREAIEDRWRDTSVAELRSARAALNKIWWQRIALVAEGGFAGKSGSKLEQRRR